MGIQHEIRQATVIQGNGPGSLTVLQEGLSVIIPGLDSWYRKKASFVDKGDGIPSLTSIQVVPDKCRVTDANLMKTLDVDFFAVPPAVGLDVDNKEFTQSLNVAVFPAWAVCYNCRRIAKIRSDERFLPLCQPCRDLPGAQKRSRKVVQVNFIVVCDDGHIDEFPWDQWVHASAGGGCPNAHLIMESSGSGDLKGQRVSCQTCKKTRTLSGTNETDDETGTTLTNKLDSSGVPFFCSGSRPWLADSVECARPIRLILRNATNLYYSNSVSSILVPKQSDNAHPADEAIDQSYAALQVKLVKVNYDYKKLAQSLVFALNGPFSNFDLEEVMARLSAKIPNPNNIVLEQLETPNQTLKKPEWDALSTIQENENLRVRSVGYSNNVFGVEMVHAVPTLVKTTALTGFSRLMPKPLDLPTGKALLRRNSHTKSARWLPAIQYVGEGIFIRLNEEAVREWEKQPNLSSRTGLVHRNLEENNRLNPDEKPTPRRIMLHTLAHCLIQELVVECGYIAAALSEKIYADEDQAGILIYTASPDADGTMGGLVEMAQPDTLARVFANALKSAGWCSNDPVCMELGKDGQGLMGTNLSACHSCCLLPETACAHFNQALDRALLVGDLTDPTKFKGFFEVT